MAQKLILLVFTNKVMIFWSVFINIMIIFKLWMFLQYFNDTFTFFQVFWFENIYCNSFLTWNSKIGARCLAEVNIQTVKDGQGLCVLFPGKGTFFSESAEEMWNRHIKVPKIVPGLLFPVRNMNFNNKMMILTFFCVNQNNVFETRKNMYWDYNQ